MKAVTSPQEPATPNHCACSNPNYRYLRWFPTSQLSPRTQNITYNIKILRDVWLKSSSNLESRPTEWRLLLPTSWSWLVLKDHIHVYRSPGDFFPVLPAPGLGLGLILFLAFVCNHLDFFGHLGPKPCLFWSRLFSLPLSSPATWFKPLSLCLPH